MGLLGASLFYSQNPRGTPHGREPVWHLVTAELPFGAPPWPFCWSSCSYCKYFLNYRPRDWPFPYTGHPHQRDEPAGLECLQLVEMKKEDVCILALCQVLCFVRHASVHGAWSFSVAFPELPCQVSSCLWKNSLWRLLWVAWAPFASKWHHRRFLEVDLRLQGSQMQVEFKGLNS